MKKNNSEKYLWDKRFMELAYNVAEWSCCARKDRKVGCVLVRDNKVLVTGHNINPEGVKNCIERGYCMREKLGIKSGTRTELCYTLHAEQNAIVQAGKVGAKLQGATCYVTHQPCGVCTKLLINAGIVRVVYKEDYPDDFSINLLKEAGIEVCKFN